MITPDPTTLKPTTLEPILVRPEEAAKLLGLGRSKLYALLADGTLPSIKLGRAVRVPVAALAAI